MAVSCDILASSTSKRKQTKKASTRSETHPFAFKRIGTIIINN